MALDPRVPSLLPMLLWLLPSDKQYFKSGIGTDTYHRMDNVVANSEKVKALIFHYGFA